VRDIPNEIVEHYQATDEDSRIRRGLGQLEFVRTQAIVRKHLPTGPLNIIDIGGATGVHASWLAADGHHVQLFDVVPEHVESARQITAGSSRVSAALGDARDLPSADNSMDAALLFGPLYHLTSREDRLLALREAARVVHPGGLVFVATISRFASLLDGLEDGFFFTDEGALMVNEDLATGQHRNRTGNPQWFTTAYFHRPEEIRQECLDAGLTVETVVGVEGPAGWVSQLADRWNDVVAREAMVRSAELVETEESLLGVSAHLITVARVR